MDTRGRRAARAAAAAETAASLEGAAAIPAAPAGPVEPETAAPSAAEVPADAGEPAQTAADLEMAAPPAASLEPSDDGSMQVASTTLETLDRRGDDAFAALVQSQAAVARGLEALSAEVAGLALSGIGTATLAATDMLGAKTLSDAIAVNAGLTCNSIDALVGGSARLSRLAARIAAEATQPILSQFGTARLFDVMSRSWAQTGSGD